MKFPTDFSVALSCALLLAASLPAGAHATAQPGKEQSPSSSEAPADGSYKNTIKWATASEVDNFGFDVLRGDAEEGPFVKLNETPIEGGGTTDAPRRYQFVDDTIDPHAIYYYYVESIAFDGTREQFTPIAKVGPKIPPSEHQGENSEPESEADGPSGSGQERG